MNPTVYRTLVEGQVEPLAASYRVNTEAELQDTASRIARRATEALEHAYLEGLRHGFQQGVEAECKRREIEQAC